MVIKGAGANDPQSSAQGKNAATAALVGFVIILSAYWIIRIIEATTAINILEPTL